MNNISTDNCYTLTYQPTHVQTIVEGRTFIVKAPFNWNNINALYYATVMSEFEKNHSFSYYMLEIFEQNN